MVKDTHLLLHPPHHQNQGGGRNCKAFMSITLPNTLVPYSRWSSTLPLPHLHHQFQGSGGTVPGGTIPCKAFMSITLQDTLVPYSRWSSTLPLPHLHHQFQGSGGTVPGGTIPCKAFMSITLQDTLVPYSRWSSTPTFTSPPSGSGQWRYCSGLHEPFQRLHVQHTAVHAGSVQQMVDDLHQRRVHLVETDGQLTAAFVSLVNTYTKGIACNC